MQTFVLRGLLSPFAHPLFTALTGLGLAVTLTTGRRRLARLAAPTGLVLSMALHGTWNAAADLGTHGFLLVYAVLMVPCFAALVCFSAWARSRSARHPGREGPPGRAGARREGPPGRAGPPTPRARTGVRTAALLGRRFAARLAGWLGGPAGGP